MSAKISSFQATDRKFRAQLRRYDTSHADGLEGGRLLERTATNSRLLTDTTATEAREIRGTILLSKVDDSCLKTVPELLSKYYYAVWGCLSGFKRYMRLFSVSVF